MQYVCGIDEAGRGPLAGPVTAAAVVLPPGFPLSTLADSKVLTPERREHLRREVYSSGAAVGIGWAWPEEIDRLNIHRATLLAMKRAFAEIEYEVIDRLTGVVVDGRFAPELFSSGTPVEGTGPRIETRNPPYPSVKPVVRADGSVPEVMAASIVAKVIRDRWMIRYGWIEPAYGYERHKGYPTREHRRLCAECGPSPIQRLSFKVVASTTPTTDGHDDSA